MNFNNIFLKSFRVLLLPFAILYGMVVKVRNYLYNHKKLSSATFNFPVICVGNLAVGGTGKSPMIEYLIRLLKDDYKIATISRGYKRKTKGYVLATDKTTALEIGDEPMQFYSKFKEEVYVTVGEERIVAIPQLLQDKPDTQVVLLDDAFQHRAINAGFNILLTEYSNRFTKDYFLPTGDLRDERSSYKRANVIVVTKCPADLSQEKRQNIIGEIHPFPKQLVLFAAIQYGSLYHLVNKTEGFINQNVEVLLVCGIANPAPLKAYLHSHTHTYYQINFNDHHIFTIDDLNNIIEKFNQIEATNKIIITTEKDAVRLHKFTNELASFPIYVLPIEHHILFDEKNKLEEAVKGYVASQIQQQYKPENHEPQS